MDVLGIPTVLVPPNPGNVSAFGLLTVDLKNDYVATAVQRDDCLDLDNVNALYAQLEEQAHSASPGSSPARAYRSASASTSRATTPCGP